MISSEYTKNLCIRDSDAKILFLVVDGLGGLPHPDTGRSELETADLPNLDRVAQGGTCGLISPLGAGFTPGSGPAHLALFGYDPWKSEIGRGALSALGLVAVPSQLNKRGHVKVGPTFYFPLYLAQSTIPHGNN